MRFFILPLLALSSSVVLGNPVPVTDKEDPYLQLSDDSYLHAALHARKEYRHGVFARDSHALEALRRVDGEEAVKVVEYAELLRRADNSSITPTPKDTIVVPTKTEGPPATTEKHVQTVTIPDDGGSQPTPQVIESSFTTTRLTTIMENGQSKTITATEVVVVTLQNPLLTLKTTATTTGTPGLQTNEAGMLQVDWVPVGMAVAAGVGRWVFGM